MTVCTIEIINLIYLESLDKFLAVKLNGIANISSVKTGYFEAWGGGEEGGERGYSKRTEVCNCQN